MKIIALLLSLALIVLVTGPYVTFVGGDSEVETPQLLLLTLNNPANNSVITQSNCDFTFTPTLLGFDKFYSANLVITSGNDVIGGFSQYYKTNQTAIVNGTYNTISYTFNRNGTYAWNVRVYNSTHSILAAEVSSEGTERPVSYILQVAVYEPNTSPQPTPTPTPTATPTPTPTSTSTPSPIATPTPTPTVTQSPTISPTVPPTNSPPPTATPSPSPSPSVTPTSNPTPTSSPTASPSPSPSFTANPSPTPVSTPILTPSPNPTQTSNPTAVPTNNVNPTIRPSPSPSITLSPNHTVAPTPTVLPSQNPTPQPTEKPFSLTPEQTLIIEIVVFVLADALLLLGFRHFLVRSKNEF